MTKKRIGHVLGIYNIETLFDYDKYQSHPHGIVGAIGQIVGHQSKIYVYPAEDEKSKNLVRAKTAKISPKAHGLLNYLIELGLIVDVEDYHKEHFNIWSRTVLKMIQNGEPGWEPMVPPKVAQMVKEKGLFGLKKKG